MKLLLVIYAALMVDLFTGLDLNLYGWGREPLYFALGVVATSTLAYRFEGARLGMIALVLCCAWLVFYPSYNGFDVVLSPTLVVSVALWMWQKFKSKK
jgi:hypothetical protein